MKQWKSSSWTVIVIPWLALCATGSAQTAVSPSGTYSLPKGDYATKLKLVRKPMSDLLDQGYKIVNLAVGLGGVGYLLRHGDSWVACSVAQSSQAGRDKAMSHCESLN